MYDINYVMGDDGTLSEENKDAHLSRFSFRKRKASLGVGQNIKFHLRLDSDVGFKCCAYIRKIDGSEWNTCYDRLQENIIIRGTKP